MLEEYSHPMRVQRRSHEGASMSHELSLHLIHESKKSVFEDIISGSYGVDSER